MPAPPSSPSQKAAGESKQASRSLNIVFGAEPRSINPPFDNVQTSLVVFQSMFDAFLDLDTNSKLAPRLAESWESLPPRSWRLKLRKGVTFHNGEPFNAEAARFTIITYRDSNGPLASQFVNVEDVTIVDDSTVDVVMKTPDATLPVILNTTFALPPKYYAEQGAERFVQKPIGTGPFIFDSWQKGESIKAHKNDKWWGGAVPFDQLTFSYAAEASTRVAMLLSGQVDIAVDVPPSQIDQIQRSEIAEVKSTVTYRNMFVEFNPKQPPFDDVRIRRAVAHAINNEELVKRVLDGHGQPMNGVFPSLMPSYDPEKNYKPNLYDPARAKALLTEAGHPNGFSFPFYHTAGRYLLDREMAQAIAGQLAAVGITANLNGLESGAFFDQLTPGNMPGAHMLTLGTYSPDEHRLLRVHFWNRGLYKYSVDNELDNLITAGLTTFDRQERTRIYKLAEKRIIEDQVYWKPLYLYEALYGVSKKLPWKPHADEFIRPELVRF